MVLGRKATQRLHHHYVLFDVSDRKKVAQGLLEGLGLLGWARAQPVIEAFEQKVVVACHPRMTRDIRAAAVLCSPPLPVISVSGTLHGLRRNR